MDTHSKQNSSGNTEDLIYPSRFFTKSSAGVPSGKWWNTRLESLGSLEVYLKFYSLS